MESSYERSEHVAMELDMVLSYEDEISSAPMRNTKDKVKGKVSRPVRGRGEEFSAVSDRSNLE